MPSPSLARTRSPDQSPDQQPLALTDEQMSALLAAAHPLPPDSRSAFSKPAHASLRSYRRSATARCIELSWRCSAIFRSARSVARARAALVEPPPQWRARGLN